MLEITIKDTRTIIIDETNVSDYIHQLLENVGYESDGADSYTALLDYMKEDFDELVIYADDYSTHKYVDIKGDDLRKVFYQTLLDYINENSENEED